MVVGVQTAVLEGGQRITAHHPQDCYLPEACPVHNPSAHGMRHMPQGLREDRGTIERHCRHGVGHPDPDQVSIWRHFLSEREADAESVHGCDGCCGGSYDQ